jgi:hypothetical protein
MLTATGNAGLMESPKRRRRLHRAYRKLHITTRGLIESTVLLVIGTISTYGLLRAIWSRAIDFVAAIAPSADSLVRVHDAFLGLRFDVLVPVKPGISAKAALLLIGACAAILAVASMYNRHRSPARYWLCSFVLVLLLATTYALFNARVAYDPSAFMLIVERTSIVTALCAPIFACFASALLPFSLVDRIAMIVLMVTADIVFSLVRILGFGSIVSNLGQVGEPNLYLFFGPLMDVVYFISTYALVASQLSKRLSMQGDWQWL